MDIKLPSKDLTKEELNKQIVKMRNVIKRARLHIINNLVHRCRKLKKSSERGVSKAIGKVERLLMEVNELKMLKADEISKFVFTNDVSFAKIAKEGTVKDRALARLSEHKFVTKFISDFRQTFPRWAVQVPSVYNIWDFQNNVMNKRKKSKTSYSGLPSRNFEVEPKTDILKNRQKRANVDEESVTKNNSQVVSNCKDLQFKESCTVEGDQEYKTESVKPSLQKISESLKSRNFKTEVRKTTGDMVIKRLNLNEESEELELKESVSKKNKNAPAVSSEVQKPRSSFFLDMDNNELQDAESESEMSEASNDARMYNTSNPLKKAKAHHKVNATRSKHSSNFSEKVDRFPIKVKERIQNTYKDVPQSATTKTEVLHPSWEAKRRQSQSVFQEFKGTKIKFDDDD